MCWGKTSVHGVVRYAQMLRVRKPTYVHQAYVRLSQCVASVCGLLSTKLLNFV